MLVALEDDGTVLGYATYGPWRPHDGYRHTVEHSLYVREGLRGRGTGSTLLTALFERARAQGIHVMVAGIDADNEGSVRLHERFGFTRTGVLPQVGTKFGRWLDLAFLQLVLDQGGPAEGPRAPAPDHPCPSLRGVVRQQRSGGADRCGLPCGARCGSPRRPSTQPATAAKARAAANERGARSRRGRGCLSRRR